MLESKAPDLLFAREFLLDSPMIRVNQALYEYALPSFVDDTPLLSAVADLTRRIYEGFKYNPESTAVATPLAQVLELRSGVCQDFAHLQVACIRAMGFPAKYVSGYIETLPAVGETRLVGADATHAWGRDYSDVTPLQGVIFGGGEGPLLKVSVDVVRI